MSTNLAENQDLRRYLLGSLTDETALQQIEERILAETEFQEELAVAESALIDEYVLGALPANETAAFESHFLAHPSRREQLRLARALHTYAQENQVEAVTPVAVAQPERPTRRWFDWLFLPPVRAAASAILLLAVGIGVWRVFLHQSDAQRANAEIAAAFPQEGPLDVRVTGLALNPPPNTRSANDNKGDARKLRYAFNILEEAKEDAVVLHTKGKLALIEKNYDEAVKQLEAALQLDPDNPQLHADLGAALLAQAESLAKNDYGKRQELLNRSIGFLVTALTLNPELLEARFNKALCLQQQLTGGEARRAWQEYLTMDGSSPWAERARIYLKVLDEPQADISPEKNFVDFLEAYYQQDDEKAWQVLSHTREIITGRMIALQLTNKYVAAHTQGNKPEARKLLSAFIYVGKLELARGGDPFTGDLAHFYQTVNDKAFQYLAQAQAENISALKSAKGGDYESARGKFTNARKLFAQAGNTAEAALAQYLIAYCLNQAQKLNDSIAILEPIAVWARQKQYKWLAAQALCWIGDAYTLQYQTSRSLTVQTEGLAFAEAIADDIQQQKLNTQIGFLYGQLGRPQRALQYHRKSLQLAGLNPTSLRQAWRNFTNAAITFYRLKQYEAAAALDREALDIGVNRLHDRVMPYSSYLHLAEIYYATKQFDLAQTNAEQALQVAQNVDKEAGKQFRARAYLTQGNLNRQSGDCSAALESYNRAEQFYSQTKEFALGQYETHKGKLLCALKGNDSATLETEIDSVMSLFEGKRKDILEAENRDAFFGGEQDIYDIAINYQYLRQNYEKAFAYAESELARSLLDTTRQRVAVTEHNGELDATLPQPVETLSLKEIGRQMPSHVQIVYYTLLPDKLILWHITSGNTEKRKQRDVNRSDLLTLVKDFCNAVKSKPGHGAEAEQQLALVQQQAKGLYEVLIAPVEEWLDPQRELCLIKGDSLDELPFAALISPADGKYLVEKYRIFYSPSATSFIHYTRNAAAQVADGNTPEKLLAIGNPAFDRQQYETLQDLPAAAEEARKIARNYGCETCALIGPEAGKAQVLAALPQAQVAHFACHFIVDEGSPLKSRLILAASPSGRQMGMENDLAVYEILKMDLSHTRLATLAACQTDAEGSHEGLSGLAEAFLAAGVPVVIASQWAIDEEASAVVMTKFYGNHAAQKKPVNESLQFAQMQMLKGAEKRFRHPYYWAAFSVIGGVAG